MDPVMLQYFNTFEWMSKARQWCHFRPGSNKVQGNKVRRDYIKFWFSNCKNYLLTFSLWQLYWGGSTGGSTGGFTGVSQKTVFVRSVICPLISHKSVYDEFIKSETLRIFQWFYLYLWMRVASMQSFTNLILFCPWEWNIFLKNMGSDQGQRKKWATNGCRHCVTRVCMYQWTLFLPLPTRCSWLRVTCQVIKRAFRGGWRGKSTPHCSMQHLERPSLTTHTRQHQQLMDSSYLSLWWHEISFACPLNIYYISANQRTMSQELHCTHRERGYGVCSRNHRSVILYQLPSWHLVPPDSLLKSLKTILNDVGKLYTYIWEDVQCFF